MPLAFPMTVRNVFDDLLLLLGIETANNAPMYIRERVLTDINATLQFIQAAGGDYFAREVQTQEVTAGEPSYPLPRTIQSVQGPVRLADGTLLRELGSRGEYDLFAPLCLGTSSGEAAKPLAYYLQRLRDTTPTEGDNVSLTLFVAPTPDATYTVTMEVVKDAGNFTYADLTDENALIPIAHQYAQSLFLPIARYNVATCPWYFYRETLGAIQNDYRRALELMGINDPRWLPPKEPSEEARRKAAQSPPAAAQPAPA